MKKILLATCLLLGFYAVAQQGRPRAATTGTGQAKTGAAKPKATVTPQSKPASPTSSEVPPQSGTLYPKDEPKRVRKHLIGQWINPRCYVRDIVEDDGDEDDEYRFTDCEKDVPQLLDLPADNRHNTWGYDASGSPAKIYYRVSPDDKYGRTTYEFVFVNDSSLRLSYYEKMDRPYGNPGERWWQVEFTRKTWYDRKKSDSLSEKSVENGTINDNRQ